MEMSYKMSKLKIQGLRKMIDAALKLIVMIPDMIKPLPVLPNIQQTIANIAAPLVRIIWKIAKKIFKQFHKEIAKEMYKYYGAYRDIKKTYIKIRAQIDRMIKGHYGQYQGSKFYDFTGVDAIEY